MKLLLGTGTTYFMDEQGRYPASNFNAISEAMGCHLPKKLVATVVESGAFAVERCEEADMNVYGIRYFASPLYYDKAEVKSKGETLKSTLKSRVNSSIINNTDNKSVLSERINEEVVDEFVEDTLTKRRYLFDDIMNQPHHLRQNPPSPRPLRRPILRRRSPGRDFSNGRRPGWSSAKCTRAGRRIGRLSAGGSGSTRCIWILFRARFQAL